MKKPTTEAAASADETPEKRRRMLTGSVEFQFHTPNEDILFEILKRADARTLAAAACVCKEWNRIARDERIWEAICAQHWAASNFGCSEEQFRSVVLALGGFRRLHALCVRPLKRSIPGTKTASFRNARWGRDEVNLSLCLLSIKCYESIKAGNV
ncbi:unnamed protein product [Rhodiola kirilowii]